MSLPPALTDCTAVYRQWQKCDATDLIALFVYHTSAVAFCEAERNNQPKDSFLVLIETYSWKMEIFQPKPPAPPSDCPF